MLKQACPPALDWLTDLNVRVALGYRGMLSDSRGERMDIPTKKPRKRKKNPHPQLSAEQKAANTAFSRVRIGIEHAMGGMQRSTILVQVFRNRQADFEDKAVGICAGLWNFALSY
jgi:DDE superfamily endonuclease